MIFNGTIQINALFSAFSLSLNIFSKYDILDQNSKLLKFLCHTEILL